jgi:hypothetical protein
MQSSSNRDWGVDVQDLSLLTRTCDMTKTFIGGIVLGTVFVFGAIVPLVLIGLLGLGLGAAVLHGGRRISSARHMAKRLKA